MLLGIVLLAVSVVGAPPVRMRGWGSRSLAIGLLLTTSFFASVTAAPQPIIVGCVAAVMGLVLTIPVAPDGQTTTGPASSRPHSALLVEPTLVAIVLTSWMWLRNMAATGVTPRLLLPYLLTVILLVSIHKLRQIGGLPQADLARSFIFFVIAILLFSPFVGNSPWIACRAEKCSVAGQIYRGIFPSENAMALFVAFTIVLAVGLPGRMRRLAQLAMLFGLLLATGGRTALLGLALAVFLGWALAVGARGHDDDQLRLPAWLCWVVAGGFTTAAMVVLGMSDDATLSGRGRTWRAALEQVPLTSVTGAGSSRWTEMQDQGLLTQHFPHSQYLHLLFGGGLIAVAIWTWLLAALLYRVRGTSPGQVCTRLLPVLLLGIFGATEIIWNPATVDSFSVLLLSVMMLGSGGSTRTAAASAPQPVAGIAVVR